jgi:hypothetical protein
VMVNDKAVGTAQLDADGTFRFTPSTALKKTDKVRVDQIAPAPPAGPAPTTGDVSVLPNTTQAKLCDIAAGLCLNQPHANETEITGKL